MSAAIPLVQLAPDPERDPAPRPTPAAGPDFSTPFNPLPGTVLSAQRGVQSSIVAEGTRMHAVYRANLLGNDSVLYRLSRDGGLTWGSTQLLHSAERSGRAPSIAAVGDRVVVGFLERACPANSCREVPVVVLLTNDGQVLGRAYPPPAPTFPEYGPLELALGRDRVGVAYRGANGGDAYMAEYLFSGPDRLGGPNPNPVLFTLGRSQVAAASGFVQAVAAAGGNQVLVLDRAFDASDWTSHSIPLATAEFLLGVTSDLPYVQLVTVRWDTPANKVARVLVRSRDATKPGPFSEPVEVGVTPIDFLKYEVAMASSPGLFSIAWKDVATGMVALRSSHDGGRTFGTPQLVGGTTSAFGIDLGAPAGGLPVGPLARFSWSVAERYKPVGGRLSPHTGPLDPEPRLDVVLDGCTSIDVAGGGLTEFIWTAGPLTFSGPQACKWAVDLPANQVSVVKLEVVNGDGERHAVVRHIMPRDLLVVSMGDGVAAGEGLPEDEARVDPGQYSELDIAPAEWQDEACHRSDRAASSQAARRLELADPHSSVTFVHLACSGPTSTVPQQLEQLQAIVAGSGRQIDRLLLSVGAQEVHLRDVIEECLLTVGFGGCHQLLPGQQLEQRLGALPDQLIALAATLGTAFPELVAEPGRVVVTDHLDPTGDGNGVPNMRCVANAQSIANVLDVIGSVLTLVGIGLSLTPPVERVVTALGRLVDGLQRILDGGLISDDEALWLRTRVIGGINATLRDAANGYGWRHLTSPASSSNRAGYCAPDEQRLVTRIGESIFTQADWQAAFLPNEAGHAAYADVLTTELLHLLDVAFDPTGDLTEPPGENGPGDAVLTYRLIEGGNTTTVYAVSLTDHGDMLEPRERRIVDRGTDPGFVGTWAKGGWFGRQSYRTVAMTRKSAAVTWYQGVEWSVPNVFGDWAIASRVAPVFAGAADISVEAVELVQAADAAPSLVAIKRTLVVAQLDAEVLAPVTVPVRVRVSDGDETVLDQTYPVNLKPGLNDVLLPPDAPLFPAIGATWSARIEVTDPGKAGPDLGAGSGDWGESITYPVEPVRTLRVLVAPVYGSGATCADVEALVRRGLPFARAVLPQGEDQLRVRYGGTGLVARGGCPGLPMFDETPQGVARAMLDFERLARLAGVDAVVAVVPKGFFAEMGTPKIGVALVGQQGAPRGAIIAEAVPQIQLLAHELAHTLGVTHVAETSAASGVWVARRAFRSGPDYMDPVAYPDAWTSWDTFDMAMELLQSSSAPTPTGEGDGVVIGGTIDLGDTGEEAVTLASWASDVPDNPVPASNLVAEQLDASGGALSSHPIPVTAPEPTGVPAGSDPLVVDPLLSQGVFHHAVPLAPSAARIVLRYDGVEVASRAVTATAPTVTVTAPTAGAQVPANGDLTVTWTAVDPDPDPDGLPMTHSVSISDDGGDTWQPLAIDHLATSLTVPVPATVSGQVVVRVVSSDGVRSGVGMSAPFTVAPASARGPQRIVYSEIVPCPTSSIGCYGGLRSMRSDGTDDRLIVPRVGEQQSPNRVGFTPWDPDWSPDGRRIALGARAYPDGPFGLARWDLFTVDAEGGDRQRVTSAVQAPRYSDGEVMDHHFYCPDWSPDGSRLSAIMSWDSLRFDSYQTHRAVDGWVVSMRPDGSDLRYHGARSYVGIAVGYRFGCPRWSVDGSQILAGISYGSCNQPQFLPQRTPPWGSCAVPVHAVVAWPGEGTAEPPPPGLTGPALGQVVAWHQSFGNMEGFHPAADGTAMLVAFSGNIVGDALCGVFRMNFDGSPRERVMACPATRSADNQVWMSYQPFQVRQAPDGRVALNQYPQTPGNGLPHPYVYSPAVCTVPDELVPEPPGTSTPFQPDDHVCVTGPEQYGPLPLTGGTTGVWAFDWSAGPVLDGEGGGVVLPDLEAEVLPAADAGGPYLADEDAPVALDATGSGLLPDALDITWDVDGDGEFDDADGATPEVRFDEPGVFEIAVRVSTGTESATAIAEVTVVPTAPTLDPTGRHDAIVGRPSWVGPFRFSDPGAGGHTATVEIDGVIVPAEVRGWEVWARVTLPAPGPVPASLTVCDDRPDPPCVTAPFELTGVVQPTVTGIAPSVAAAAGGTPVELVGRHLEGVTAVLVDGAPVAAVAADDGRTVSFTAPAGTAGSTVRVTVAGASGAAELTLVDWALGDRRAVTEPGQPVRIVLSDVPTPGFELLDPPRDGRLADDPSGVAAPRFEPPTGLLGDEVVYVPDDGFVGVDEFRVRLPGAPPISVRVKVGNVAPVAGDDEVRLAPGAVVVLDPEVLLSNDVDPDADEWEEFAPVARFAATSAGQVQLVAVFPSEGATGDAWMDADDVLRVRAGASGVWEFLYVVADRQGGTGFGRAIVRVQSPGGPTTTTTSTTSTPSTSAPPGTGPTTPPTTASPPTTATPPTTASPPTTDDGGPVATDPSTTMPEPTGTLPETGGGPGPLLGWAGALVVLGVAFGLIAWSRSPAPRRPRRPAG